MSTEQYANLLQSDYDAIASESWPAFDDFIKNPSAYKKICNEIDSVLDLTEFTNQAFCVLPFFGIELPRNISCCLMQPTNDLSQVKFNMLNGIRPPECQHCWGQEDLNILSDRQIKNNSATLFANKGITQLVSECHESVNAPIFYKIDTSNICNATCITCNSAASTAWAALELKNKVTPIAKYNININQISKNINYTSAKTIIFRGGESLLSKTNFQILSELVKANNTDCFISFVTNGSIRPSSHQLELLSKFKNLNFCFSIDGIGPVFDYLRYPLKWDNVLSNLYFIQSQNIDVTVSYTLSNLNVFYHNETTNWFNQEKLSYYINKVINPRCFQANVLPDSIKSRICATNNEFIIELMKPTAAPQLLSEFMKKIKQQDQWKNIHMKQYLVEFAELLSY